MSNPAYTRTAEFSPCRRYRYQLRIVWDASKPLCAFIGLNPSVADETQDDPTVRRCIGFAKREGCGGLLMLNLFAFRATDPRVMKAEAEPVGITNYLAKFLAPCTGPWIAAWGTHGSHLGRGPLIADVLDWLQCLGTNRDGSPKHPLYVRADTPLVPYPPTRQ